MFGIGFREMEKISQTDGCRPELKNCRVSARQQDIDVLQVVLGALPGDGILTRESKEITHSDDQWIATALLPSRPGG